MTPARMRVLPNAGLVANDKAVGPGVTRAVPLKTMMGLRIKLPTIGIGRIQRHEKRMQMAGEVNCGVCARDETNERLAAAYSAQRQRGV